MLEGGKRGGAFRAFAFRGLLSIWENWDEDWVLGFWLEVYILVVRILFPLLC